MYGSLSPEDEMAQESQEKVENGVANEAIPDSDGVQKVRDVTVFSPSNLVSLVAFFNWKDSDLYYY